MLASKTHPLTDLLDEVKVVNVSALNTRLFRFLCQGLDGDYMRRYYSKQKGPLVVTENVTASITTP